MVGVGGGWREQGRGCWKRKKAQFFKKKENLEGWERVEISYDLVCTLRKNLIYNRRHLVSVVPKKRLSIKGHYGWVCSEKTDVYRDLSTPGVSRYKTLLD